MTHIRRRASPLRLFARRARIHHPNIFLQFPTVAPLPLRHFRCKIKERTRLKRVILLAALSIALSLTFAACACAQTVTMEDIYAQIDFPDTWLVLSPQLLRVYEPLLSQHGFDVNGMAERYESEGVIAEAWDADFAQSMRVMVTRDERAQTLFTLDRSTTAERNSMAK